MFMFTRKKEESRIGRALERMVEKRGIKRHHRNDRAQSVPPKESPKILEDTPELAKGSRAALPLATRGRSASCTALDWFAGELTWRDVEASGYLQRSGSYRSVEHEGPEIDITHDHVKTGSPTVIQFDQSSPSAITPLSAELVVTKGDHMVIAGRSPPPPTTTTGAQLDTTHNIVDNDRVDVLEELAIRSHLQRPLLSVDIPEGTLSPPAEVYQMIWGKS